MKQLIVLLFLLPVMVIGQKGTVNFEREITPKKWTEIFEKAEKEGKYVFVFINSGFYGDSTLSQYEENLKYLFSDKEVSGYFNKNFINVFIEPFTSRKRIYQADPISYTLITTYKIHSYPICLVFDNAGRLVHKFLSYGLGKKDSVFINQASKSFDKNERYYSLIEQYNNGNRDTEFLKKLFRATNSASDTVDTYVIGFIQSRDNLFTKGNAEIIMNSGATKVALEYFFANLEVWNKVVDKEKLGEYLKNTIKWETNTAVSWGFIKNVDSRPMIENYSKKYGEYGKAGILRFLIYNYGVRKNNNDLAVLVNDMESLYSDALKSSNDLNEFAWSIFQNITDTTLLNKALSWSKKSLEQDKNNPAYLDTYANILYKLGLVNQAIEIETKAVELVDSKDKKSYEETLDKMKKGKPTWR